MAYWFLKINQTLLSAIDQAPKVGLFSKKKFEKFFEILGAIFDQKNLKNTNKLIFS